MTLRLEWIEIKNFRSCKDLKLHLSGFTPLIGYNNVGKSNCLSAIEWLLKKKTLNKSDFFDPKEPIEISGRIAGITEELLNNLADKYKNTIEKYVNSGVLKVLRRQPFPNAKVSDVKIEIWDFEKEEWILNPTGIENAISALFPEPIRIGAMEDAVEDVTKHKSSSTIGKLLTKLTEKIESKQIAILEDALQEVSKHLAYDGEKRFKIFDEIDKGINKKISDFFPGIGVRLHFEVPNFNDLFKTGTIKVFDELEEARDFESYGTEPSVLFKWL